VGIAPHSKLAILAANKLQVLTSMFKRKLTQGDYFLIVANMVPVIGAIFLNWDPKEIFIVYCLETIIVGLVNLLKMGIVTLVRPVHDWHNRGSVARQHGLFFMFFFLIHYGIFTTVQMGIFFGVSGIGDAHNITLFNFFFKWPALLTMDTIIMVIAFAISYTLKVVFDFILTDEYRRISLMHLMFQPYGRIFIQQVAVILGSMGLLLGGGTVFLVIFACVKIFFELRVNFEALIRKASIDVKKPV
jgi:hypothetical protein